MSKEGREVGRSSASGRRKNEGLSELYLPPLEEFILVKPRETRQSKSLAETLSIARASRDSCTRHAIPDHPTECPDNRGSEGGREGGREDVSTARSVHR